MSENFRHRCDFLEYISGRTLREGREVVLDIVTGYIHTISVLMSVRNNLWPIIPWAIGKHVNNAETDRIKIPGS